LERKRDELYDKAGVMIDHIRKILGDRLVDKGIAPDVIPAYIRDLSNTTSMKMNLDLSDVNRGMERLGWNEFELDDHTLQLITALFESDCEIKKVGEELCELKRVHIR
jgi:hypothetical protein